VETWATPDALDPAGLVHPGSSSPRRAGTLSGLLAGWQPRPSRKLPGRRDQGPRRLKSGNGLPCLEVEDDRVPELAEFAEMVTHDVHGPCHGGPLSNSNLRLAARDLHVRNLRLIENQLVGASWGSAKQGGLSGEPGGGSRGGAGDSIVPRSWSVPDHLLQPAVPLRSQPTSSLAPPALTASASSGRRFA